MADSIACTHAFGVTNVTMIQSKVTLVVPNLAGSVAARGQEAAQQLLGGCVLGEDSSVPLAMLK